MVNAVAPVTVGLPVYNDPDGLRRSVPTVFNQTWDGEIRLLVVDDGSDDATAEALEELAATYGRLEVVRNASNRGRPHARNQILEHVEDGYLTWLDAGDLYHPRKLEVQLATLRIEERGADDPVLCTSPIRRYFLDTGDERVRRSAVSGDQLHDVIIGRLYPYLWTMLGRVEHFRAVGGFDERLMRRQDYDFLVRFVAGGGRVVTAPEDQPLVTYVKSDAGSSARDVARASRLLRRKHRPLYRRYGRAFAWRVRRKQFRQVARFWAHNGREGRAAVYRGLARLSDPAVVALLARPTGVVAHWVTRTGSTLRGTGAAARRGARATVRVVSRPLLAVMPMLRRLGLTALARRVGVTRAAERLGVLRIFYDEVERARGDGPDPGPPVVATGPDDVVGGGDGTSEPSGWLSLAESHRRAGRLHSARAVLERGLARHPDDGALRGRLVALLGQRGEWAECARRWSELDATAAAELRARAYVAAARSFRHLGDVSAAIEVAEAGLRRWPDHRGLRGEFYRGRAARVDWSAALRGEHDAHRRPDAAESVGTVTHPGFLRGGAQPLRGWVRPASPHLPRVALEVNGRPVVTTHAAPRPDESRRSRHRFSLNCTDLLLYLGDGDVVSVTADGAPVALPDGAPRWVAVTGYGSRVALLGRRLDRGSIFTGRGRLRAATTSADKRALLQRFSAVSDLLERELGHRLYPLYSTLLGAVREHDLILHDDGDLDAGYLSAHDRRGAVGTELAAVCRALAAHDHHVRLHPWGAQVSAPDDRRNVVALHVAWFTPDGELALSSGWRSTPATGRARFLAPRDAPLGLGAVRIPGDAEAVLGQIYGPGWATLDQGFAPGEELTHGAGRLLTPVQVDELSRSAPDRIEIGTAVVPRSGAARAG